MIVYENEQGRPEYVKPESKREIRWLEGTLDIDFIAEGSIVSLKKHEDFLSPHTLLAHAEDAKIILDWREIRPINYKEMWEQLSEWVKREQSTVFPGNAADEALSRVRATMSELHAEQEIRRFQ